jgi:CRP-like cAMP-binding protein
MVEGGKMAQLNLKDIPLFSGLKGEELDKLSQKIREKSFSAGNTIITEDNIDEGEARCMYLIKEGEVEVLKEDWFMNEVLVNTLKQGNFFGEMSLIDNKPRSTTVRALSNVVLYSLTHEDLRSTLSDEGYDKVIVNIAGEMGRRIGDNLLKFGDMAEEHKLYDFMK